jgi:hypothetical protein
MLSRLSSFLWRGQQDIETLAEPAPAPTIEAHPDSFLRFSSLPKELQREVVQQCETEDLLSLSKYNSILPCVLADHA